MCLICRYPGNLWYSSVACVSHMESLDSALPGTEAKQRQSYKSDDVAPSFLYIKSTLSTRSLHSLPLLFDFSKILLLFPHFPPPSNNFTKLLAQLRRRFFYKVTPPTSPHPQTWTVCPSLGPNSARCCPAITRLRLYQNCSFKCLSPQIWASWRRQGACVVHHCSCTA